MITACDLGTGLDFPSNAVPFEPPAPYRLWWAVTESCSGTTAPFESVSWYVVPDGDAIVIDGEQYAGIWFPKGNRIVLARRATDDGHLVRHEILHALLRVGGHPATHFMDRCGGYVSCGTGCAEPQSPPTLPPPESPVLDVRELDVAASVIRLAPSLAASDGWAVLVTEAASPLDRAAWVRLVPLRPDDDVSASFGWYVHDWNQAYEYELDTLVLFGAGERRRSVADLRVREEDQSIRAFFNVDTVVATPVTVVP